MSKRSRVNRADSFDQPNYPNKNSSTKNPEKFSKPSSALSNNVVAATAAATTSSTVEETQYISEFLKECFLCKSILKLKNDTYMYKYVFFVFINSFFIHSIGLIHSSCLDLYTLCNAGFRILIKHIYIHKLK